MKKVLVLLLAVSFYVAHADVIKRDVLVPDEATAIAIAKAVLIPIFGQDFNQNRVRQPFSRTHTFYASVVKNSWIVEDAPPARLKWTDPILRVEIDKKRGCILNMYEY